jgi:hypothetical protein
MEKLNEHTKLKDNLMEVEVNVDRDQLYKNRGGELLKVARKTDVLKARIKKIEDNLMEMADDYLEQNGQPLLIFDQTMVEYLNKQYKKRVCINIKIKKNKIFCLVFFRKESQNSHL